MPKYKTEDSVPLNDELVCNCCGTDLTGLELDNGICPQCARKN